ncbi:hypothetical protein TNIN_324121, partial [Trichonephila inaurata madagascariensis]
MTVLHINQTPRASPAPDILNGIPTKLPIQPRDESGCDNIPQLDINP